MHFHIKHIPNFTAMIFSRRSIIAMLLFLNSIVASHHVAAGGIDFEDLTLDNNSHFDGYGAGAAAGGSWQSGGASFNTNSFGPGWSYSNINDTTTAGFTNQFAAITGSGVGDSGIYAMATAFAPNEAIINLFAPTLLADVQVTNSTYAALSMLDGDAFTDPFGGDSGDDPDFFMVTFTGFSETDASGVKTGGVDFYLADYRSDDNYIIEQWTTVDLTGLGNAHSIAVTFSGSDVGQFGLNTPAYVAIDNIRFAAIPEPSGAILLVIGVTVTLRRRKTKVKCRSETRQEFRFGTRTGRKSWRLSLPEPLR